MAALGRHIVMLGFAGVRIALTLAELHRDEVELRFPRYFRKKEEELRNVSGKLSAVIREQGLQGEIIALQEDEIFPSLWKLAESADAGLDVELKEIPISQFVIEVCELFDVNPYVNMDALENKKCFSKNDAETIKRAAKIEGIADAATFGLLVATDETEAFLNFAEENQIPAAVIGRLTERNDRVVRNGEIIRYLTSEG